MLRLTYVLNKNYEVSTASSGREALQMFQKENNDIVLVDLTMPGVSGMEVLKRLEALLLKFE